MCYLRCFFRLLNIMFGKWSCSRFKNITTAFKVIWRQGNPYPGRTSGCLCRNQEPRAVGKAAPTSTMRGLPECARSIQVMPALGKRGRYKPLCKSSVYLCFPFNKISLAFLSLFISLSAGHLCALTLMWLAAHVDHTGSNCHKDLCLLECTSFLNELSCVYGHRGYC